MIQVKFLYTIFLGVQTIFKKMSDKGYAGKIT